MTEYIMTEDSIKQYADRMLREEKSRATIEKYSRCLERYMESLPQNGLVTKENALAYKDRMVQTCRAATVNGTTAALNGYFSFMGWELRLRPVRRQRQIFAEKERELTKEEYRRLLYTAKQDGKERLWLILQTICATGIRISELKYVTVEAVNAGKAQVNCKGKCRIILIPGGLCRLLQAYCRETTVNTGSIFVTRYGNPIDRSNIWSEMKQLCASAGVDDTKVFPHNLRHLFARSFYDLDHDLARLADVLGHASISTTRIYIMTTPEEHERQVERLDLLSD